MSVTLESCVFSQLLNRNDMTSYDGEERNDMIICGKVISDAHKERPI